MENNILQLLAQLLGGQNKPTESHYYPSEAYPQQQKTDPGNLISLLSLLNGNNNQLSTLSKILSGGDNGLFDNLLRSNKKSEDIENNIPHDDIIL